MKGFFRRLFTRRYRAERLRRHLENNTWITDPSNANLAIYIQAAHLLGIQKTMYSWGDLGKSLGMMSAWGLRLVIQDALFLRIGQDLQVPPLPKKTWENHPKPAVKGIANKLGLQVLSDVNKMSLDFIVFAFVDYKRRQ